MADNLGNSKNIETLRREMNDAAHGRSTVLVEPHGTQLRAHIPGLKYVVNGAELPGNSEPSFVAGSFEQAVRGLYAELAKAGLRGSTMIVLNSRNRSIGYGDPATKDRSFEQGLQEKGLSAVMPETAKGLFESNDQYRKNPGTQEKPATYTLVARLH